MSSTVLPQCWGLLRRRTCWLPTLRGWLLLFVLFGFPVVFGFRHAETFLAVNDPVPDGVLVVEGWSPDYALKAAKSKAQESPNHMLYVIGGPLEQGAPLSEYKTFAELGAATLLRMGMSRDAVQAVPAPYVSRDRTYAAAIALRNWFREHGNVPREINLISTGAHARRSRLLFGKAFGNGTRVGVMDIEDRDYDPRHWWKSSQGVRSVLDEMIAYGYARFLFSPSADALP
jgi:hypothetical protein